MNEPKWECFRHYKTQEAALLALKSWQQRVSYTEYPGTDHESLYPEYLPLIVIRRFKLVEELTIKQG